MSGLLRLAAFGTATIVAALVFVPQRSLAQFEAVTAATTPPPAAPLPTADPAWDASYLRTGTPPPSDNGIEPPYPGPCSSDLSAYGWGATTQMGAKSVVSITLKQLQVLVAQRLESCYEQIRRSTAYQRYLVSLQQTVVQSYDCDPRQILGSDAASLTALPLYQWVDRLALCANYVSALASVQVTPAIISTRVPILYVIMASGGVPIPRHALAKPGGGGSGSSSATSQTSASSATGAVSGGAPSQGASGVEASSSSVDNTTALLLYSVAHWFQRELPDTPLPSNTLVIPASLWTIEDFDNQCALSPLARDGDEYRGTYGAILLDGATVNSPNEFWLVKSIGWTRAHYAATLVTCDSSRSPDQLPTATVRWHAKLIGTGKRTGFPLLPLAAYAAYTVPGLALKGQAPSTMTSIQTTTGNVSTTRSISSASGNDAVVASAEAAGLGTFLESVTQFTLGDISQGITVPSAYSDYGQKLATRFIDEYCDGWLPRLSTPGCMRQAADAVFLQVANIYRTCDSLRSPAHACHNANHAYEIASDTKGNPELVYWNAGGYHALCTRLNDPVRGLIRFFPNATDVWCREPAGRQLQGVAASDLIVHQAKFAASLFCYMENGKPNLTTAKNCPLDNAAAASIVTPSPAPSPVPHVAASIAGTTPGPWADDAVRLDDCRIETTIDDRGSAVSRAVVTITTKTDALAMLRIKVWPYDQFAQIFPAQDAQATMIADMHLRTWSTGEYVRDLPMAWQVTPGFVKCLIYGIRYWPGAHRVPWVAPTPAAAKGRKP